MWGKWGWLRLGRGTARGPAQGLVCPKQGKDWEGEGVGGIDIHGPTHGGRESKNNWGDSPLPGHRGTRAADFAHGFTRLSAVFQTKGRGVQNPGRL